MATAYTSVLRLAQPATGELSGTWGDTVNNNITAMIEQAVTGKATVAMADANQTLTTANGTTDQARCMMVECTGALTADRNVVCPTATKMYIVNNLTTGSHNVVFKTSGGTGITVLPGTIQIVYCDGTNVVGGISSVAQYLKSATTSIDVFSATAPSSGQVLTATSSTAATWQAVSTPPTTWTTQSTTATALQTTFTISGGYTTPYIEVYLNGARLPPADYTATNGTTVVLGTGASLNDELLFISYVATTLSISNLSGGLAGEIPYQIGVGSTGYSAVGTAGQVLLSGGTGAPTWGTVAVVPIGAKIYTALTQGAF